MPSKLFHELFEAQTDRTADTVAVVCEQEHITYGELNARANQLARYLQKLGVGPEVHVGLYLERSIDLLVGLLGILKAGGAYVPLDPSYPAGRLSFIFQDAGIPVLLTQQHLGESFPISLPCQLYLDAAWTVISQEDSTNPTSQVSAQNLAYIMYTSGSTGRPKGVLVHHEGLSNLAEAEKQLFDQESANRVLQFASFGFDASVWDLLLTFPIGGTLFLATLEARFSGSALLRSFQEQAITTATLTPSVLATLPAVELPMLHTVVSAGEACSADLVADWVQGRRFFNAYGPTEATVCATIARYSEPDQAPAIGYPLPNTQVYLLDTWMEQVPTGTVGEICIGGQGVTYGYLNLPALTAEHFVPDPFNLVPGTRLYKTRDLGRTLSDGSIEFLGRIDHQVKIRGLRIELGEIESLLSEHPDIREAVVLVHEDLPGEKRLVGYVVAKPERQLAGNTLRRFLQSRLPDYMIPSIFLFLESFPLTPSDKIDRRALPVPENLRPELETPFEPPHTTAEEIVAGIWSKVLRLEPIGIYDHFFDLGGHSLAATQIVSRIREAFQRELPLQQFFAAPTVAELVALIEREQQKGGYQDGLPIRPVSRDTNLPLSFAQERVWFLEQLTPYNTSYTARTTVCFTGPLHVWALEQSLNEIVRRHEIFRTTFPSVEGRPMQIIHQALIVTLPVIDLQNLLREAGEVATKKCIEETLRTRFDVTQLPLVCWMLLRLGSHEHILIQVEHHLMHDGWSFNVLIGELLTLYKGFVSGQTALLPELPLQFADFAHWQRQWLQEAEAEAQLAYWKMKLAASPPVLLLPTDYPRPAMQSFRGEVVRKELSATLCTALRTLSREKDVTLFTTMFSAFLILLYRYTRQDDICVGTGVANRRWRATEDLIGMIINTLVLRVDLTGNPTFDDLLRRVRETTLEAYTHQDLPFDKVVEALQPKRDLSYNPLFQVAFSFHDAPHIEVDLPDLGVEVLGAQSNGSAKFDLNVIFVPRFQQWMGQKGRAQADDITMIWEYCSDLFDHSTIVRMVEHFETCLTSIIADPMQRISIVPLLSEQERWQQLVEWNATTAAVAGDVLPRMIEDCALRTPEATAVECQHKRLTYRELNLRANQLAHYLQGLGVRPESLVGICLDRSPDLVIGLLAILKVGGAYLPLDLTYPRERLLYMLADAQVAIVLTTSALYARIADQNLRLVCLDSEEAQIALQSTTEPSCEIQPENVAYVIYTSGSTGSPKGVQVTHRSLRNLVCWHQRAFALTGQERTTQLASLSFDAATWEIWPTLATGATLCMVDEEIRSSPEQLPDWLAAHQITVSFLPTPLAESLLEAHWPAMLQLRLLLTGGDLLHHAPTHELPFVLVNNYGPTESCVVTTSGIVQPVREASRAPSIGRPIANTQVYVLDEQMQQVPSGVPGELYIGGYGLARGYMHRPELTAERFLPHPFATEPGARLYKTGDLVRYRPDGQLEFLGRSDHQVKIRGFRIEPGEIEAVLCQHPLIRVALVVVHEDTLGNKSLVAYPVSEPGQVLVPSQVRQWLQATLPDYMIPAAIMPLDRLPLTSNGKLARHALPAPEISRANLEEVYVPPQTPTEELLTSVWAEVLGVEHIGIYDNFFELGGHSLLATQMLARVQRIFQVEVPLRTLFEQPRVAGFALAVLQNQSMLPETTLKNINGRKNEEDGEHLLAKLDQLSDEEVDALFGEMFSAHEGNK